ncbi:MAG: hypothetical protein V3T70_05960, partial [Phycisphaerae bacterium]
ALPGGDPLAAALAAGETPAPDMVAAAGESGGMRPAAAVSCLGIVIVGLVLGVALAQRSQLINLTPLPHAPAVLAAKAREVIEQAGYVDPAVDVAFGFRAASDYLDHLKSDSSPNRWQHLGSGQPAAMRFWYRQSPDYLGPISFFGGGGWIGRDDPPFNLSDMVYLVLDTQGRLLRFEVIPPQHEEVDAPAASGAPDWSVLFEKAGLDSANFNPAAPAWTPPVFADRRIAWEGAYPDRPDIPLRIEAAAYGGKPVYFELISPWTKPQRMVQDSSTAAEKASNAIGVALFLLVLLGSCFLARRNLRLGRGDRRGASRLALFVLVATMLSWLFRASHIPTFYELGMFVIATAWALFITAWVWMLYVALEPYVRRRWPHALISWSRLLAGRFRDPLVGRDILIGAAFGILSGLVGHFRYVASEWLGRAPPIPMRAGISELLGMRRVAASFLSDLPTDVFLAMGFFFVLFVLRVVLRRPLPAAAAFVAIFAVNSLLTADDPLLSVISAALSMSIFVIVLLRFGLLAQVACLFVGTFFFSYPLTYHIGAWYAGPAIFAFLSVAGIAAYGFHTALAGRSLFRDELLDA